MTNVILNQGTKAHICAMPKKPEILTECSHCHQPLHDRVEGKSSDKVYCCYGCKVVDELMDEHASLIDHSALNTEAYRYLDEAKIRAKLCKFEDEEQGRIAIHLPSIHCSSCIYLLENLAQIEEGIISVQVHFSKKEADIRFQKSKIQLSEIAAMLEYIGYKPDFKTQLGGNRKVRNRLLLQLGVAGFFFGNTMLLALPEYFDSSLQYDPELQSFFRYLMMAFSLPVVLYSAKDYFTTAWKSLRAGSLSIDLPIAIGIITLFVRSAYEVFTSSGSGYFDSLCALVFFLLIGKWYQAKTYRNFSFDRDLRSFLPLAANRLSADGMEEPISIDDLKAGDQIRIRQGEVLPADSILLFQSAKLDYSYLSGESLPVQKEAGSKIYAGARLLGKAAVLEVQSTVDHSYLSSLWSEEAFSKEGKSKKSITLSDRISQYFTPAVLLIALLAAAFWWQVDSAKAILIFTSVLIVACPCALALAEPFAAGSMMRWFGRFGFFLKNTSVLQRLPELDHVVFDKTGTLTRTDSIEVEWHGDQLSFEDQWAVATIALNAQHPLAKVLLHHLNIEEADASQVLQFEEASGEGVGARVRASYFRMGKASFLGLSDEATTTAVYLEKDAKVLGYFSFYQQTRASLHQIADALSERYALSLLSGDNDAEKRRFRAIFGAKVALEFNCSPHDKLEYLRDLQEQNNKVLMLGDGLNDAGALQQSEVGVSLCEKDISFFPASDALLMADSFPKLDRFLKLSRQYKPVVYRAFALSLAYNIVGISIAAAGYLSPVAAAILMPVSSVTVVLYSSLYTAWMAKRDLA